MRGLVLAAGRGSRLGHLTETIPKTLLDIGGETTILDVALGNLAESGVTETAIVVGFAAGEIAGRRSGLENQHQMDITLVHNDRGETWNNAYSLWLATPWLAAEDTLLINGDTVHPSSVERALIAATGDPSPLLIAIDDRKVLGAEEMKVLLGSSGTLRTIAKGIDPRSAQGEYIGVSLIRHHAAGSLRDALEATWTADPARYYEDGYQVLVDRGIGIGAISIGAAEWVEVDTYADLARAREIVCRS